MGGAKVINSAYLAATYVEYMAAFQGAFQAAPAEYELFTEIGATTRRSAKMFWGGSVPQMREWLGDAQFHNLEVYVWEHVVKKYQAGLEVPREDIVDDDLGWVDPYIKSLGTEARLKPGRDIYDLINNGETAHCYDGQFFFETHPVDRAGPTQSNKTTGALTEATFNTMRTMFSALKDTNSRLMGRRLTHLLVPTALENTAKKILAAEYGANGATNVENGAAKLIVSPFLTSAVKWYGFDLSSAFRPFKLTWRERPEFVAQDSPTDEQAFNRQVFRYNAWGRWATGYNLLPPPAMSTRA